MERLEDKMRMKLWEIVGRYLGKEKTSHGLPHIHRVHSNFVLFKESNPPNPPVSDELLETLESAVLLHDIGYSIVKDYRKHAAGSVKILNQLSQNELSDLPHQEWVHYAIANHSIGLRHELRDEKDLCLAFLVVFDHMDGIGAIGIFRIIKDFGHKIPLLSQENDLLREIKHYLAHPEEITREHINMKESSILEHLTYNYCATSQILSPIRNLLSLTITEEIQRRLNIMRDFIVALCREAI